MAVSFEYRSYNNFRVTQPKRSPSPLMPLHLDIQKKLTNRSERVKAVDFHPSETWVLSAMYSGSVNIWNYNTQSLVKTFHASDLPIRASKFIARKNWLITGSDDLHIRVFNYNTHEKVIAFEAHQDYIRSLAVHPSQPFILTASDDMTIKLWDWEKGWKSIITFEGHTHYVMQIAFNPKDGNTFASASLDKTIKVWSLGSANANYTLEGHSKGVNCVDYYYGAEKPYLISGADDKTVKIWDYQNKSCVNTLEGHTQNITVACFHPELPIIVTGSEDGTVRIWHSQTYRLENTLNYGMERIWAIAYHASGNDIALGYDEGTVSIQLGREEPAVSMDTSGKLIFAKNHEIFTANIKASIEDSVNDGDKIQITSKDLGNSEIFPQQLEHSPNGRFVVICGDGEYIIYTALAWRNKSFGKALDFCWALDTNEYAVRESTSSIKLFKSFQEKNISIRTSFLSDGLFGGILLAAKSSSFIVFYDWQTGNVVRRIDVVAKKVLWSDSESVIIVGEESFFVLKFNRAAYQTQLDNGVIDEEGVEDAFELITEIAETVKTGCWVGDCFIYTNSLNRMNYFIGGQVSTLYHFDIVPYILGYVSRDNRIYLTDKDMNITSYLFPQSLIDYQTAILRQDFDHAQEILPLLNSDQKNKVAKFLETHGYKAEALEITTDAEHKFDLAFTLDKLEVAYQVALELNHSEKWKLLGDQALKKWNFTLTEECLKKAQDLDSLLILYQASGNLQGMQELIGMAEIKNQNNIAFMSAILSGNIEKALSVLTKTERYPEAAFMARTYAPSKISHTVSELKKHDIESKWTDPTTHEEMFSDFKYGLVAEEAMKSKTVSADDYSSYRESSQWDIVSELKQKFPKGMNPKTHSQISDFDSKSDVMSHISMEVNTTGTGSIAEDESPDLSPDV